MNPTLDANPPHRKATLEGCMQCTCKSQTVVQILDPSVLPLFVSMLSPALALLFAAECMNLMCIIVRGAKPFPDKISYMVFGGALQCRTAPFWVDNVVMPSLEQDTEGNVCV